MSTADNEALSERVNRIEPSPEAWDASVVESEVSLAQGIAASRINASPPRGNCCRCPSSAQQFRADVAVM